jgi:hypothetical protein
VPTPVVRKIMLYLNTISISVFSIQEVQKGVNTEKKHMSTKVRAAKGHNDRI